MSIEATCDTCDRTFLLEQIGPESTSPGRCPFCGTRFGRHYTTVLMEAIDEAESSSRRFVTALGRLQEMETGFDVKVEKVVEDLGDQVRAHAKENA